jgi:hypothetical protein
VKGSSDARESDDRAIGGCSNSKNRLAAQVDDGLKGIIDVVARHHLGRHLSLARTNAP